MSNHNEISSFIWRVCDDELRGLFKPYEYGEVILPFVVLRRLDCLLEPTKDEVVDLYNELKDQIDDPTPIIRKKSGLSFYNSSKFDLKRLKSDPNGLKMNFPNYLNGFSENVFQIIENFQLDKPVEKLLKNNKLYSLIDKFTEVDLHPEKVDNHTMGSIFEELLRKFSEMSNETSGEHYTPRDIVNLLVSLVFTGDEENLKGDGIIRTIFDPCCGTGGMLTIGKDWVNNNISQDVRFQLYGQELNPQTFSICKSDFLITGEEPNNIRLGSSLSDDQFIGKQFDYMITNPPFGVSWKSERDFVEDESKNPQGRFSIGLPTVTDGQLLFLQHLISKMRPSGSKIGIVFNDSPLLKGGPNSGESKIRRFLFENDLIESIVRLPKNLFFNTPLTTYLWIINNKKKDFKKGKTQLIDISNFYTPLRKNLGDKKVYVSDDQILHVQNLYKDFRNTEVSRVIKNEDFGYKRYTVVVRGNNNEKSKKIFEKVSLSEDFETYFEREIKPNTSEKIFEYNDDFDIGYEIPFNKYFFELPKVNDTRDILTELGEINRYIEELTSQLNEMELQVNKELVDTSDFIFSKIPKDWVLSKNKYWFRNINNGKNKSESVTVLSLTTKGVKIKTDLNFGKSTESYVGHQLVKKGDIVFTPRDFDQTPILSGVSEYEGCISNLYIVDQVEKGLLNRFVDFLWWGMKYRVDYFKNFSFGMRSSFNREQFDDIPILIPPIKTQEKILEFLDKQNTIIEELISLEEKKIELLKTHRQTSISQIVFGYKKLFS